MTTATTSNEICTDCGFPFDCPDGHGECNGQFIEQAQPPEAATPRPWKAANNWIMKRGVSDIRIGVCDAYTPPKGTSDPRDRANTQLIVRAVNAHDGLVAALRDAIHQNKHNLTCQTWNLREQYRDTEEGLEQCDCWRKSALEALKLARGE